MKSNYNKDLYFGVSDKNISLCSFDINNGKLKEYTEIKLPDNFDNNLNFNFLCSELLNCIKKFEKNLNIFITNGVVSIKSEKLEIFSVCFKKFQEKKKINSKDISRFIKGGIKEFIKNSNNYSILHILVNKYIVDNVEYSYFPENTNSKIIILEVDFLCLEKNFFLKIKNLFKSCKIEVKQYISFDYSKKFINKTDENHCVAARKVFNTISNSEVKFIEKTEKNTDLFDKIFNFFN